MTTATEAEMKLAELALRKSDLQQALKDVRAEMRRLYDEGAVVLPVYVVLNGHGVMISKPQYHTGPVQCKVTKVVHV